MKALSFFLILSASSAVIVPSAFGATLTEIQEKVSKLDSAEKSEALDIEKELILREISSRESALNSEVLKAINTGRFFREPDMRNLNERENELRRELKKQLKNAAGSSEQLTEFQKSAKELEAEVIKSAAALKEELSGRDKNSNYEASKELLLQAALEAAEKKLNLSKAQAGQIEKRIKDEKFVELLPEFQKKLEKISAEKINFVLKQNGFKEKQAELEQFRNRLEELETLFKQMESMNRE